MHPVLFEIGTVTVYSYGFMIALGTITGVAYMAMQGKKEVGLTFDQANALFLLIFIAAFAGGKVFLLFEDFSFYFKNPLRLATGRGFVFYGSFLFAVPVMLWFFRKHKLNTYVMLDVMAVTTCLVHMFGRVGCFLAGCCYGKPTDAITGVSFSDPSCYANPKGIPLHPTQLYEAFFILIVLIIILFIKKRKKFHGQLFLTYLILYALGRFTLEYLRGDLGRGFVIERLISHSQLIATGIFIVALIIYSRWQATNKVAMMSSAREHN